MKIEFRKIGFDKKPFSLDLKSDDFTININGSIYREQSGVRDGLIKLDSTMSGTIKLVCDISGEEFIKNIDEKVIIFVKNGYYEETHIDENLAVVEVFDNFIDLDSIFLGEIESLKLDYHRLT